jgi:predicted dehydrogenase
MPKKVGVIGCGDIFDVYMDNSRVFRDIDFVACASQNGATAQAKAHANGLRALSSEALLNASDIDIVLILTPSSSHATLAEAALKAGKHVYMEKTIAGTVREATDLVALADKNGLRIGVAPDTFLGPAVQVSKAMIDEGRFGEIILGTATAFSHGMEFRHPNPEPFYQADVGPVTDLGPYLITSLVSLLGPVRSVISKNRIGNPEREITAPGSAFVGQRFAPQIATTSMAVLEFRSGAIITMMISWDVWHHGQPFFELHGSRGSLRLPHYNWFGGELLTSADGSSWQTISTDSNVFGVPNWSSRLGQVANYRGLGLAEMASAIERDRPHRATGELALHVLDVLEAIKAAATDRGEAGRLIGSTFQQAPGFDDDDARSLL